MRRFRFLSYFTVAFIFGGGALLALLLHVGLFEVDKVPVELISPAGESGRRQGQGSAEKKLQRSIEASLQDLRGKRIWEIDLTRIRASIARDEWVKDILISRIFPNEVRVLIRPKAIALMFVNKQNEFFPVAEDGALLGALPAADMPDVPLLRGDIFVKDSVRRSAAVKFVRSLAEHGPLSMQNISEIAWTNEDGYTATLIQPKIEVKLGEDRVDLKALRVSQVLNYLSANNLKGRVIDASFSKKVLVRLRKGP